MLAKIRVLVFIIFIFSYSAITKASDYLILEAFGGELVLPKNLSLDISDIKNNYIKLSNLNPPSHEKISNYTTIRVGTIDKEATRFLSLADKVYSCFGFSQSIKVLEFNNRKTYVSYFQDDHMFVHITTTDSNMWINTLEKFIQRAIKEKTNKLNCGL